MKRLFDVVAASAAIVFMSPLLAMIALAILSTIGRPILFRQRRPGMQGKPFVMYKFRTMLELRDEHGELLQDIRRLTRFGRFLRNASLDELPELFNVLRGEMSLVGPRPLLMDYLERYTPEQARRHDVMPGITGLAQVHGRNAISWEEKFKLDVYYVDNHSLWLDMKILLLTLVSVIRRRDIDAGPNETMAVFTGTAPAGESWELGREMKDDGASDQLPSSSAEATSNSDSGVAAGIRRIAKAAPAPERIYLSPPHMTLKSRELLLDAFDSNWIAPMGPHVDALEREFAEKIGVEYAVAVSSGTAALHLALHVLDVGPGDEVATATLTFAATANAIRYVGATPVFIDSERSTWNLDPELLAAELEAGVKRGRPLKAVVSVDICGQCADYDAIRKICNFYEVPLIEDAAEALGATYRGRPAGAFGEIGCFSFNGNKIITTSGGGMVVTSRRDWAERVRRLASQARDPAPHYEHSEVGFNYRLSNLLAAIGRAQLEVLEDYVDRRRANFRFYEQALGDLPGISFMPEHPEGRSTRWLSCMIVDSSRFGATSDDIRMELERKNIESRPIWKPMHLQPAYRNYRVCGGEVSEELFENGLCLPSGSNLSQEDLARVVAAIHEVDRPSSMHAPLQEIIT